MTFTCPDCGSHKWGTYFGDFGSCHGTYKKPSGELVSCRFKWERKYDGEYFVKDSMDDSPKIVTAQIGDRP